MTSLSTSTPAIAATSPSPSELSPDDERQAQSAAFALALATALDFGALAWLAAHPGLPNVLLAAALHAGAVALVMARSGPPRSQCLLAAALTLTLPLAGAPIAALMRGTDGRGAIGDTGPQDAPPAAALARPRICGGWPRGCPAARRCWSPTPTSGARSCRR